MSDAAQERNVNRTRPRATLLSSLGLAAAVAALAGASCCVLPLLLASAGMAGAWIAHLEIFVVHRRSIIVVALLVIGAGWWIALRRQRSRGTLLVLGCATALVLAALVLAAYEQQIARLILALRQK